MRKERRRRSQRKRFLILFVLIGLVLPYLQFLATSFPRVVTATTNDEQLILEKEKVLKATARHEIQGENVQWTLDLVKAASEQGRKILFKVTIGERPLTVTDLNQEAQFDPVMGEAQGWLVEKEFSTESTEKQIQFSTTIEEAKLVNISLQVEELASETQAASSKSLKQAKKTNTKNTTNTAIPATMTKLLSDTESGPHPLAFETTAASETVEPSQAAEAEPAQETEKQIQAEAGAEQQTEKQNETDSTFEQEAATISQAPQMAAPTTALGEISDGMGLSDSPFKDSSEFGQKYISGTTSSEMNNVKNYLFDSSTQEPSTAYLNNGTGNLVNGYHDYGDVLLKKTVSPTNDPATFDVQLDMIGDVIKKDEKIKYDVVFVLDKSSSMNNQINWWSWETRWNELHTALDSFIPNLLGSGADIQMALTSFGSKGNTALFTDISNFDGNAYTKDSNTLLNSSIYTTTPPGDSGTPSFLGIESAYRVLYDATFGARSDAKKVMIFLSDGDVTFYPTQTSYHENLSLTFGKNNFSNGKNSSFYAGDGTSGSIAASTEHTTEYVNNLQNDGRFSKFMNFSISFFAGHNGFMETVGTDGYAESTDANSLVKALNAIQTSFSSSISNATLTDPMSDQVTLKSDSVKISKINVSPEKTISVLDRSPANVEADTNNNSVNLSNITLGGDEKGNREGLRVTYQVQLKEEYQNGQFYPANKDTYLTDGDGSKKYFAVPSVRAHKFKFQKVDMAGKPLAGAEFKLVDGSGKEFPVKSDSSDTSKFVINGKFVGDSYHGLLDPGDYELVETKAPEDYQKVTAELTVDNNYKFSIKDNDVSYETSDSGLILQDGNNLFRNERIGYDLKLQKTDAEGRPLSGAKFEISGGDLEKAITSTSNNDGELLNDGEFLFKGEKLHIGQTYTVTEIQAPDDYAQSTEEKKLVITADGAKLAGNDLQKDDTNHLLSYSAKGGKIENSRKPAEISVVKVDSNTKKPLAGVGFSLSETPETPKTKDADGLVSFEGLDWSKTYTLEETSPKEGYRPLETKLTITYDHTKHIWTATGDKGETFEQVDDGDGNPLTVRFKIENQAKTPLPATGGSGRMQFILAGLGMILTAGFTIYYVSNRRKEVA